MKKLIILLLFMTTSLMAQSLGGDSYFTKGNTYWTLTGTDLVPATATSLRLNMSTTNYHTLTLGASSTTNLNGFNFVNTNVNRTRTSLAQATDTSSVSLSFLASGKPIVNIKGATGNTIFSMDSTGNFGFGANVSSVYKAYLNGEVYVNGRVIAATAIKTPLWSTDGNVNLDINWTFDWPSSPKAFILTGWGADGSQANINGGDIYFKTGKSTGTGSSALHIFTTTAGSTGTTVNNPTEKMTILGNGNVGIGTTTPDKKFGIGNGTDEFSQDVTSDKWTLWNDAATPAAIMTVDSVGNVATTGTIGNSAQQTITLGAGATTLAVSSNVVTVTGDGGANTIATITGAVVGVYVFIFVDANVTITDTDAHTADTVDLAGTATNFTSADDKTLTLVYDGTSWYQTSTSTN